MAVISDLYQILDPSVNSSSPGQNGHHFADDIFKRISLNENVRFFIRISLKFLPKGAIENNPVLI